MPVIMLDAEDSPQGLGKVKATGAESGSLKINHLKLERKLRKENVPIQNLKPYPKNPKQNNNASVEALAKSIEKLGYLKTSITVDEDYVLLTGHTTLKALKKLKWTKVPEVDMILGLSEDEKNLYRINDNKLGMIDEWDDELLSELYCSLDEDLRAISGFNDSDFNIEPKEPEPYDESVDELSESKVQVKLGDCFSLGRHFFNLWEFVRQIFIQRYGRT